MIPVIPGEDITMRLAELKLLENLVWKMQRMSSVACNEDFYNKCGFGFIDFSDDIVSIEETPSGPKALVRDYSIFNSINVLFKNGCEGLSVHFKRIGWFTQAVKANLLDFVDRNDQKAKKRMEKRKEMRLKVKMEKAGASILMNMNSVPVLSAAAPSSSSSSSSQVLPTSSSPSSQEHLINALKQYRINGGSVYPVLNAILDLTGDNEVDVDMKGIAAALAIDVVKAKDAKAKADNNNVVYHITIPLLLL